MDTMKRNFNLNEYALYLAWIVSLIATLGSLYFSEIKGYIPCELCWYQRIAMYPLSIILGIAAYENDNNMKKYVLPLSIIGGLISIFHYLEQKVPAMSAIETCKRGVPCNVDYINWLGFITIPFLAFIAFSLITLIMIFIKKEN